MYCNCNFIPDDIFDKIDDPYSKKFSRDLRDERELLSQQAIPVPRDSEEVRVLYHGQFNERLDENEKYILAISQELDSIEDKPEHADLELFDDVYDFFMNSVGLKSYDNRNAVWRIFKHVGDKYNNAFWNGRVFAFGDGDQVIFKTFMVPSVVTHEAMHAITENISGLIYQGQPGALNESMSDVFAICVEHKLGRYTWFLGEGIWTDKVNARGLRSFTTEPAYDDPILGRDNQPKHMRNYYTGNSDNQGVHINSGIPNHAFYSFCMRSGLYSYEQPMKVWYAALSITGPYSSFEQFAINTVRVAPAELKQHLIDAWNDVGINATGEVKKGFLDYIIYFIKWLLSLFR